VRNAVGFRGGAADTRVDASGQRAGPGVVAVGNRRTIDEELGERLAKE
jgi:hypothetical protein